MKISPELKKRLLTGIIGGLILLGVICFGGRMGVFFFSWIVSSGMVLELSSITFELSDWLEKRRLLLVVNTLVALGNFVFDGTEFQLLILSFLFLFTYFLFSARRHSEKQFASHFKELIICAFALIYVIFIPLYFLKIYDSTGGVKWIILFLCIVWSGDTAAYFGGKWFGKNKLYPEISPKKTREGAVFGLLAGVAATVTFKSFFPNDLSWIGVGVIPILVGPVAQLGDLCESFFKRSFDKKDAGSILPGHGGFLDRFDGVVFSLPIMYICLRIFA